jgi:hypothetical protein
MWWSERKKSGLHVRERTGRLDGGEVAIRHDVTRLRWFRALGKVPLR